MSASRSHPNPSLTPLRLPGDVQQPTLYYRLMRRAAQMLFVSLWNVRVFGRHHEPTDGGVVYISNHQSFLDPVLATLGLKRPGNYMARDTLFANPLFRRLIESLNAFPIRRGRADTAALKEAMRRLRNGRAIVIFPEGTRTRDGRIGKFLPGVAMLSQRAAKWTVPVVIDGAYETWPRTSPLPLPGPITVAYGEPIAQEEARKFKAEEFVSEVRRRMIAMQHDLRRRTGRTPFEYEDDT